MRFVSALYRGVLRREPDEPGSTDFVNAILTGRSHASIVEQFIDCEEFKSHTAVKLFVPPGHFYSPIVHPIEADRYLRSREDHPVPESLPGIALDRAEMIRTWQALLPFLANIPFPGPKGPHFHYYFDNPAYSWGDGSILYAMLRFH